MTENSSDDDVWFFEDEISKPRVIRTEFNTFKDIIKYSEDFYILLKNAYLDLMKKKEDQGDIYQAVEEFFDPYYLYHHYLGRDLIYKKHTKCKKYILESYKPGDAILLELHSGQVYDGEYISTESCNKGFYQILNLKNVCKFPHITRQNPLHRTFFYNCEIKDLRILPHNTPQNTSCPAINGLTYEEFLYLTERAKHCELHTLMDCRFKYIINYMKSLNAISVIALGAHVECVRFTKISYLVIGTNKKIYIFDFISSGERFLDMGLRDIFEDVDIQKVVYDGKILGDLFKNKYRVDLKNIHDIGIVDYCIRRQEDENLTDGCFLTYPQLANKYLLLPTTTLQYADKLHYVRSHYRRPCPDKMRWRIGLSIAFMLPIYRTQIKLFTSSLYYISDTYVSAELTNITGDSLQQKINTELEIYKFECEQVIKRNLENSFRREIKLGEKRAKLLKQVDRENKQDAELLKTAKSRWGKSDNDNVSQLNTNNVENNVLQDEKRRNIEKNPAYVTPQSLHSQLDQVTVPASTSADRLRVNKINLKESECPVEDLEKEENNTSFSSEELYKNSEKSSSSDSLFVKTNNNSQNVNQVLSPDEVIEKTAKDLQKTHFENSNNSLQNEQNNIEIERNSKKVINLSEKINMICSKKWKIPHKIENKNTKCITVNKDQNRNQNTFSDTSENFEDSSEASKSDFPINVAKNQEKYKKVEILSNKKLNLDNNEKCTKSKKNYVENHYEEHKILKDSLHENKQEQTDKISIELCKLDKSEDLPQQNNIPNKFLGRIHKIKKHQLSCFNHQDSEISNDISGDNQEVLINGNFVEDKEKDKISNDLLGGTPDIQVNGTFINDKEKNKENEKASNDPLGGTQEINGTVIDENEKNEKSEKSTKPSKKNIKDLRIEGSSVGIQEVRQVNGIFIEDNEKTIDTSEKNINELRTEADFSHHKPKSRISTFLNNLSKLPSPSKIFNDETIFSFEKIEETNNINLQDDEKSKNISVRTDRVVLDKMCDKSSTSSSDVCLKRKKKKKVVEYEECVFIGGDWKS